MQQTHKTGGSNEDGCQDSRKQRDQAGDADRTAVIKAGKEQKALNVNVAASLDYCAGAAYVQLRLESDVLIAILDSFGVAGWNDFLARLSDANIAFSTIALDAVPPVMADIKFTGIDLRGRDLDGISLRYCLLDGATFAGCSLRGAVFWRVEGANFMHADLRDARFEGSDLTGTDFTGANTSGIVLDEVTYFEEAPPVGLPAPLLALCEALPWDHVSRRVERKLKESDETNAR